jgi:DNA-binding MarR family transcriptional regulator
LSSSPTVFDFDVTSGPSSPSSDGLTEFLEALEMTKTRTWGDVRDSLKALGLTTVQFLTLLVLEVGGSATMTGVAKYLGIRPQTATAIADALETHGFVERVRDPHDRRISKLRLTAKGRRALATCRRKEFDRLRNALSGVPEEALRAAAVGLRAAVGRD